MYGKTWEISDDEVANPASEGHEDEVEEIPECLHIDTYEEDYDVEYEEYDEVYHRTITFSEEVCDDCGEVVNDTIITKTKDRHKLRDGVCRYCGYEEEEEECSHDRTYRKSYSISYEYVNRQYHNVVTKHADIYCRDCNELVDVEKVLVLSEHYFDKGVCTGCGYRNGETVESETYPTVTPKPIPETRPSASTTKAPKVEEDYSREISQGKAYIVGQDGHMYKRLEDDDRYVHTLRTKYDNFTLPMGEILIARGNYLYNSSGEIVSATESILKICDLRIDELKTVIEQGAKNAYAVGTITKARRDEIIKEVNQKVDEYKKVKRGQKSLSQVEDYSREYKARTGAEDQTVGEVQEKLSGLGFTSQQVTNHYGSATLNNVAYFQIVNGLEVTGWVDDATYNKMLEAEKPEASIEEVLSNRGGVLMVHAIGNKYTKELKVYVSGVGFQASDVVDDNELWFSVQLPETGKYTVRVQAISSNGMVSEVASTEIDVIKYTIIQEVFEDMAEETQLGYEIQAGILTSLASNLVVEPANSLATAIDYVINSPDSASVQERERKRREAIQEVDAYLENALPYGTGYYHAGRFIGNYASIAVDAVIVLNGVTSVVKGVKTLPSGLKIAEVVGSFGTQYIIVDGEALASATQAVATGGAEIAIAVVGLNSSSEWQSGSSNGPQLLEDEKPNSAKLARNMEAAGRTRPRNYPTAAHHIVAGTSHKADEARAILKKFGIGINDEANGIFLSTAKGSNYTAYHPSLHSNEYYEKVNKLLGTATSREDAISILRKIAEKLVKGTF